MPHTLRKIEVVEQVTVSDAEGVRELHRIRRICATPTGYLIAWFTLDGDLIDSYAMTEDRAIAMLEQVYVAEVTASAS